jgi:L-threonylcarbamoyladenylate synthase
VVWSDAAEIVASAFWPGPLTLVLPLREGSALSALVTADLPTLAVRVPGHPVARDLLAAHDGPIAAPSANPSGRISPTEAAHVLAGLQGRIEAVIDGCACTVGVESTILGLAGDPVLLRPGGVPVEALEVALGRPVGARDDRQNLTAPGQMRSHYAPRVPVRLEAEAARPGEAMLGFGAVLADLNLSLSGDLTEAAANLFHHLHALDATEAAGIAVSPIPEQGLGRAINDRLRRAAAPKG